MPLELPDWAREIAAPGDAVGSDEDLLDRAVAIACESARRDHGPFGSVIADAEGTVVAAGHNHVVHGRDSTAHAEIHAIRRAEANLDTHDLSQPQQAPLTLYASCAPCVMCFGALYWSGLDRVVAAASSEQAEALGFMEGPVTEAMWARAREEKNLAYEPGVAGQRDPAEPFRIYEEQGGTIY